MPEKYSPRSDDPLDKEKEENPGEKEKEHKSWLDKTRFSNLAEPAIIVVITTAFFYMVVAGYYISYYKRLSISFYSLDLPLTFYLYAGNNILNSIYWLIISLFFIRTVYYGITAYKKIEKNKETAFMYLMLIVYSIVVVTSILNFIKNVFVLFMILLMILISIPFFNKAYKEKSYKTFDFITLSFIFIFLIFISIPSNLGNISAESLVRGDAGNLEVKLDLDNKSPDLLNKTLMLVIHSDSKYYLVEKNESVPKEVNLYIIPDDQIKMIMVKPVEKEQRKFYEFYKEWRFI